MAISDLKLYNEKETIEHVNSLMFERKAATKGETKAINYIQRQLNKENIESSTESFKCAKTINILAKSITIFIFSSSILFETIILWNFSWILIILDLFFIALLCILLINLYDMTIIILLGRRNSSENLIAKITAVEKKPKRPLIIFSAHYDSNSSKYPYNSRRYFYLLVTILGFPFIISILLFSVWTLLADFFDIFNNNIYRSLLDKSFDFSYLTFIFLILGVIVLLINRERSESLGSIDNASGVSILIGLIKLLSKNPLQKADVLFLWCGAEEWDLWGSKQFCAKHFNDLNEEYDLDNSYNINVDMIGSYIGLVNKSGLIKKQKMNEKLVNILEASAKMLNIPLTKYDVIIEPRSDHMSFRSFAKKANKKMQVCCFTSNSDAKFIHTSRDTPNKCSYENLNGCVDICYNAIRSIDLRVE